jgi:hypothetical protein
MAMTTAMNAIPTNWSITIHNVILFALQRMLADAPLATLPIAIVDYDECYWYWQLACVNDHCGAQLLGDLLCGPMMWQRCHTIRRRQLSTIPSESMVARNNTREHIQIQANNMHTQKMVSVDEWNEYFIFLSSCHINPDRIGWGWSERTYESN